MLTWKRCVYLVSEWFQRRFKSFGEFIGSHPVHLITMSMAACFVLGFGMMTMSVETDTEVLHTPMNSRASKDRAMLQDVFPDETGSTFIRHTLTKSGLFGDVIFSAPNILSNGSLTEIKHHVEFIKNITIVNYDAFFTYQNVCAVYNSHCVVSGEYIPSNKFGKELEFGNVTYPIWNNNDISDTFGIANVSDGYLISATYARITFHLRQDSNHYQMMSKTWEDEFIKAMSSLSPDQVSVYYASSHSLNQELEANAEGIGVDDMFLLMSSWSDTHSDESSEESSSERKRRVKERIGRMFASAGIGITITSLTDLLAFVIGATSVFVGVRNFCVYTGVAVIFCYLYQCFFFSSCLAIHGRRVAAKRHCVTCLKVKSREEYKQDGRCCCVTVLCGGKPPADRNNHESICEALPRKVLPKILFNIPGKVLISLLYIIYISISIWGACYLQQGLDQKNLVSKTSYFHSYSIISNNFDSSFPIPFIFNASTDYRDPQNFSSVSSLLRDAESDIDVSNSSLLCWIIEYRNYKFYDETNITTFITGLESFLSAVPIFQNDVVFANGGIAGSRCYLFSTDIKDSNLKAAVMTRMRALADNSPLPVYVYHPAFIYFEQYVTILPSTLQTIGVVLAVMTFVTFIFLPHPLLVLLVVGNILSILTGIFGFLYIFTLTLSSITMIQLIMSVGLSVDFSVLVCSAFMLSDGETRQQKAESAIVHAAGPILNGGLSSFLGIIVLIFSESYVFQSFFKIMLLVILFGILHAVFLLPVVLSVIGPMVREVEQPNQVVELENNCINNPAYCEHQNR